MFWERLYSLCEKNNIKPNTLAKSIGLSTAIATKWKNGTIPKGEILIKIADYFDCSIDYLLGRTESIEINNNNHFSNFSKNDIESISNYFLLNAKGQEYIIEQLNFALSQSKYKKLSQDIRNKQVS